MDAHILPTLISSILLSHLLPWYFFGVLSVQVYFYSQAPLRDKLLTRALVCGIYALQLSQITLFAHESFSCFVASRTLSELLAIRSTWFSIVVNVGLVACCVQLFYAWKIYIISRTCVPAVCVLMISVISLAFCLAAAAKYKAGVNMLSEFDWDFLLLVRISLATGSVCDIAIAGLMILYLKRHSPAEFRFQSTVDLVNRIVRLYIETGTLTACMGFLTFVVICVPDHPPVFQVLAATIPGVDAAALMAVINSRVKPVPVVCTVGGSYVWPEDHALWECGRMSLGSGECGGGGVNLNASPSTMHMVFQAHPRAASELIRPVGEA